MQPDVKLKELSFLLKLAFKLNNAEKSDLPNVCDSKTTSKIIWLISMLNNLFKNFPNKKQSLWKDRQWSY